MPSTTLSPTLDPITMILYSCYIVESSPPRLREVLDVDLQDEKRGRDLQVLSHYSQLCTKKGFKCMMMKGHSRSPGDLLLNVIKSYSIDTAVVGMHSKGGLGSYLMDSTAQKLLSRAKCNVIVIKQPHGETEEEATRRAQLLSTPGDLSISDIEGKKEVKETERDKQRRVREEKAKQKKKEHLERSKIYEEELRRKDEAEKELMILEKEKRLREERDVRLLEQQIQEREDEDSPRRREGSPRRIEGESRRIEESRRLEGSPKRIQVRLEGSPKRIEIETRRIEGESRRLEGSPRRKERESPRRKERESPRRMERESPRRMEGAPRIEESIRKIEHQVSRIEGEEEAKRAQLKEKKRREKQLHRERKEQLQQQLRDEKIRHRDAKSVLMQNKDRVEKVSELVQEEQQRKLIELERNQDEKFREEMLRLDERRKEERIQDQKRRDEKHRAELLRLEEQRKLESERLRKEVRKEDTKWIGKMSYEGKDESPTCLECEKEGIVFMNFKKEPCRVHHHRSEVSECRPGLGKELRSGMARDMGGYGACDSDTLTSGQGYEIEGRPLGK